MTKLTTVLNGEVKSTWVDYNGHMGDYAYGIVFSDAVTAFMDMIGVNENYRRSTKQTVYLLEWRIAFLKECHEGQKFSVTQQLLDVDSKRFHGFYRMINSDNGEELAICEQLLMHMQQSEDGPPRARVFPDAVMDRLESFFAPQKNLACPAWVGTKMGIRRKS